jgi:carboxypeptidase PM20D1
LITASGLIVVLGGVLLVRTMATPFRESAGTSVPAIALDTSAAAERLAQAVRFRTVAPEGERQFDGASAQRLHEFLRRSYRRVHEVLSREMVGGHSVLYRWDGSEPQLKPILLMGHLDVVPIEPGTERDWLEPPFSGRISEGYVWGRGTIDDKSAVLATLEAVELLLESGFRPRRTVYLAFGHDEETRGREGAVKIAELLRSRSVGLEFVLDEGLFVLDGIVPGIADPVALIGTAEKGWLTVTLTATGPGGHSSVPPQHTAVGSLATAIQRLEANPMPAAIRPPVTEFFAHVAPEMSLLHRVAFANLWLFGPLVRQGLGRSAATNAIIRTTSAVTVARAGTLDNVLPKLATAVVNFRILPGDTTTSVMEHARRVIADPNITVEAVKREEPSSVSASSSVGFKTVARTIRETYPQALVAPGLVPARTDSAHFADLSESTLRFRPLRMTTGDLQRIHGTNERIAVDSYAVMIKFYARLLRNAAS